MVSAAQRKQIMSSKVYENRNEVGMTTRLGLITVSVSKSYTVDSVSTTSGINATSNTLTTNDNTAASTCLTTDGNNGNDNRLAKEFSGAATNVKSALEETPNTEHVFVVENATWDSTINANIGKTCRFGRATIIAAKVGVKNRDVLIDEKKKRIRGSSQFSGFSLIWLILITNALRAAMLIFDCLT